MAIHPAEEATIRAFIVPSKRDRYLMLLANSKRRTKFLACLNHCHDFDGRYAIELSSIDDMRAVLWDRGAPKECHVISDCREIDGRSMLLADAVDGAELSGWGTILCCIPGRLGCYLDEAGSKRRLLLIRSPEP